MKDTYIYDIESYQHLFCVVFRKADSNQTVDFEISRRKNEAEELIDFLRREVKVLVGFNNLSYDYPVLDWIIRNRKNYISNFDLVNAIFMESNRVINEEFSAIRNPKVKQIDLYRIHHFNNKARATSLKALEIAMRLDSIKDLPYSIIDTLTSRQMDEIIEYCKHDVYATYEFYNITKPLIELRKDLGKKYKLNLINANDPKMGEEILLTKLSEDMGVDKRELRNMRTYRNELVFDDYILPYIKFETKEFNDMLSKLKQVKTNITKGAFKEEVLFKGIQYHYGQGGIHACIEPGVYIPECDEVIIDLDVKSFYPNIAIVNNFRPEHLGESFSRVYNGIYIERGKYPKSDARNYGLKIALNGSYGKSNDENSFLYDPKFTMQITLNGQLSLTMLIEQVLLTTTAKLLQANTDGFTVLCKKSEVDLIEKESDEWCKLTKLILEEARYSKMIIRDVNNYIAVYEFEEISKEVYDAKTKKRKPYEYSTYSNGAQHYIEKYKTKGAFEIDRAWYKNHSMLVVPKAIFNFYIKGLDYKEYVRHHKDLLDFCKRGRSNKGCYIVSREWDRFEVTDTELQKNNRYIISTKGVELIKILPPLANKDKLKADTNQLNLFDFLEDVKVHVNRETNLEAGFKCTLLNEITSENINNYDINYNYYIDEVEKITNVIEF